MITIQKCKCAILKLGLLRFDISHRYLYALLFFFFEIRNSERYRVIVGYIHTPGRQVSEIFCEYYYYGWIHIADFTCYSLFGFNALIFLQRKNMEQHFLVIVLHNGCNL